jgi:hypothetical protein
MPSTELKLKLYVAGTGTASTQQLVRRIERAIADAVAPEISGEIEIVSVMDDPVGAYEDNVVATPTLVRSSPAPKKSALALGTDANELILSLRIAPSAAQVDAK